MIVESNYTKDNIIKIKKYFETKVLLDERIIEKHLNCLGLLESFSKIGMNFVLSGNMATYLMCEDNLYLPINLEIMINRQDFLDDNLLEANKIFSSLNYEMVNKSNDLLVYKYSFKSVLEEVENIEIYLNVVLRNHIINDVASVAIDKPYLINENRIYRVKTPIIEKLFAETMFQFSPTIFKSIFLNSDSFSLYLIKKVLDLAVLYKYVNEFDYVIKYYQDMYDDFKNYHPEEKYHYFICDSFNYLMNIYCKGTYRKAYYKVLEDGIKEIQEFRLDDAISKDNFFLIVGYPLLAYSCLYRGENFLNVEITKKRRMNCYNYAKTNLMKKYDRKVFNIVYRSIEIFEELTGIEELEKTRKNKKRGLF